MVKSPWQQRIRRAEHLSAEHPFAAEVLTFYAHLAEFQEGLHQRLENGSPAAVSASPRSASPSSAGVPPVVEWASRPLFAHRENAATNSEFLASFPSFLELIEKKAPAALVEVARGLLHSGSNFQADLLDRCWTNIDAPADPAEFLVQAFLQPYAEFIRSRVPLHLESYSAALCPFCNRKPALGVLRQQGDAGKRNLLCGFCLTEWDFRRVVCPGCGQEDHAKLPVYTAESFPYIRVECCDSCQTYIKSIDLTKNGLAVPLVDELASIPLNLWAHDRGYAKLRPNLLGM
ncbi:MAG: formate dehydrogenase accessory protein FdhE [Candidatus Sulfotelmatobacter sp.]